MSKKNKDEFQTIVKDILENNKFKELDNELHHGITRYGHSCRVAKATYKCAKLLKFDYKTATRGALLHDFYLDNDFNLETSKQILVNHPNVALVNAKQNFDINNVEANIIKSHMFPLNGVMPKYKESWVVTVMDKGVALYEMYRFKFKLIINFWALFIINVITMNK